MTRTREQMETATLRFGLCRLTTLIPNSSMAEQPHGFYASIVQWQDYSLPS
jgi:hypothetical protein